MTDHLAWRDATDGLAWRDRGPDGRALDRWRWAVQGASVWLAPQRLAPGVALVPARVEWPVAGQGAALGFWLGIALRQHVWRAMARVRGFQPVIEIAIADAKARAMIGGVAARGGAVRAEVPPGLAASWVAWAARRAGEVGGRCSTKS